MEENVVKTGHPVLGVVLGLIGLALALPLAVYVGVIGGCISALLGIIAIILGVRANRGGRRGTPAVVIGVLAVLLAIIMTVFSVFTIKTLHDKAVESGTAPLVAKYAEKPYFGVMGILNNIPRDETTEATLQQLMDEFNQLSELVGSQVPANAD